MCELSLAAVMGACLTGMSDLSHAVTVFGRLHVQTKQLGPGRHGVVHESNQSLHLLD